MAAAKALTKEQRKHIQIRLSSIYSAKATKLQQEFNNKPENQYYGRVVPQYPNVTQVLLKLAGFESPAVIQIEGETLKEMIIRNPNMNPSAFCLPINSEEVLRHNTLSNGVTERRRVEVESKNIVLKNKYNQLNDILTLTNDVEYITNAISEFENWEV